MRFWTSVAILCLAGAMGVAQDNDAAKANQLWQDGKRLEALPLYEELAKAHPSEWLYAERLAVALEVKAQHTEDAAERKALLVRMRDIAKHAVEAGDPNYYVQLMANTDPNALMTAGEGAAGALMKEAEKAFGTGDYPTALAKYSAAADADPKLYEAPLYAGDTAYSQKDLTTAAKWFARAIEVDPNRETAYRYWGDAIFRYGNDPMAAREKFIQAIVAEPYNRLAWQGLQQWAQVEKAVILAPKIDRPAGPTTDTSKPNAINITIDPGMTDDKKSPGASAWMMYSLMRASYQVETFKKDYPDEKQYRHSLKEEDMALGVVAESLEDKKVKQNKLDESLRNLLDLKKAGMLDCWILISAADQGIAQDYAAYRKEHRQQLYDYLDHYVVHGGMNPQR
ncbi:MAG TPA: tetratricopeptide repeat protein [Terracidiphilus sp.]|nr:tetratricopeptide repeat protein [Terracidiphilus sp.]